MTTPRWLTRARRRRDEILENDAAIRQIQEDRSDEASFEGNYIKRLKLEALEKERARLSWRLTQALARGAGLDPYAVDEVCRQRLIFAAFGTGLTPSGGGDDATPEMPVDPGDMTEPEIPLEPSETVTEVAKYWVQVPIDVTGAIPNDAQVIAMFSEAAFLGGLIFSGLDWVAPAGSGNDDIYQVAGLAIPADFEITGILSNPDTPFQADDIAFFPIQSNIVVNGTSYKRYIGVDQQDWIRPDAPMLPYRLETS